MRMHPDGTNKPVILALSACGPSASTGGRVRRSDRARRGRGRAAQRRPSGWRGAASRPGGGGRGRS
jgi:hypothetical protein